MTKPLLEKEEEKEIFLFFPTPLKIEVTRFILFLTSSLHYQSYPGVSKIIFVQENEDSKDEFKESRK